MKSAAIYARVVRTQQRAKRMIANQTAALTEFARRNEVDAPKGWIFEDGGYSEATLARPGEIKAVLAYVPDRLNRSFAHQILLIEEFARSGIENYGCDCFSE